MKHWFFWHQPRSWRHRAHARAAMRLRHDVLWRELRYWARECNRALAESSPLALFETSSGPLTLTIPQFKRLNKE